MPALNVRKWAGYAWHELTSYRSDRLLEVEDPRLGFLHKLCLLGAAAYLVWTVIVSHSYMEKESPKVSVNAWVEGVDRYRDFLERGSAPWYCNSSDTEYVYSENFQYWNNTCDFNLFIGEVTMLSSEAVQFLTYYQDQPEVNVDNNKAVNAFAPGVEKLTLAFSHSFSTSIGISGTNTKAMIRSETTGAKREFPEGSPIRIQVSELLKLTGIDLDERNANSGGLPPASGRKWPLYRMTGVSIPLELKYENFRRSSPFDFRKELKIDAVSPKNTWTGAGRESFAKWVNGEYKAYARYSQVISVTFDTAGLVGTPRAFEAIVSIAVTAAIFGVVKMIVDTIGTVAVGQFFDMKTVDEADRQNMKTAYERAKELLMKQQEELDSTEFKEQNPITSASVQDVHRRSVGSKSETKEDTQAGISSGT
eukprot:gb/GECG01001988.1/.p1 GENE.gb/GECG01001988.1/~~gb/GECG01001988.1/.p1  ORF type:complete len:421 (+),score=58.29 gb/GECG01001988.1/:1-1263(+)